MDPISQTLERLSVTASGLPATSYQAKQLLTREDYHLKGYAGHVPGKKFHPGCMTNLEESSEALNTNGDSRASIAKGKLKDISPSKRTSVTSFLPTRLDIEAMESRDVYKATITPGYKGHVPRAYQEIGRTFTVEKVNAFQKFLSKQEEMHSKEERIRANAPPKLQTTTGRSQSTSSLPPSGTLYRW